MKHKDSADWRKKILSLPTSPLINDIKSKFTEDGKWGISYCFHCCIQDDVGILRYPWTKRTRLSLYVLWCSPSAQSTGWAAEGWIWLKQETPSITEASSVVMVRLHLLWCSGEEQLIFRMANPLWLVSEMSLSISHMRLLKGHQGHKLYEKG